MRCDTCEWAWTYRLVQPPKAKLNQRIAQFYFNFRFINFQKTATAVAYCKRGCGLIRVNGRPLDQIEPKVLQYKLQEPILLLGKVKSRFLFVSIIFSFEVTPSTWWYNTYPEIDVTMKWFFLSDRLNIKNHVVVVPMETFR